MPDQEYLPTLSRFTTPQILFLMELAGVEKLPGTELVLSEIGQDQKEKIRRDFLSAGIIQMSDKGDCISPEYQSVLRTVFQPEAMIVAVRSLPQYGDQTLIFKHVEGKNAVLHSFPEEGVHRIAWIQVPHEIQGLLADWFPLTSYVSASTEMVMAEETFEEMNNLVQAGRREAAIKVLADLDLDEDEKEYLVGSIDGRIFSGSFAAMKIKDSRVLDGVSYAIVAGPSTAWQIERDTGEITGIHRIRIRRIGMEFSKTLDSLIRWFE